jgi:hypothetical protein
MVWYVQPAQTIMTSTLPSIIERQVASKALRHRVFSINFFGFDEFDEFDRGRGTRVIYSTRARMILTASLGRSLPSVATSPILFTTLMPSETRPKMVCLLSNHGVGANVMKNYINWNQKRSINDSSLSTKRVSSSYHTQKKNKPAVGLSVKIEGKSTYLWSVRVRSRVGHAEDAGSRVLQSWVEFISKLVTILEKKRLN